MPEFDKKKTIAYWMSSSRYDVSVANALMKSRKYPYALFMGHLSLEKLLKALVVKMTDEHAPFSHSLPYLAEKSGIDLPQPIHIKLREVMEFHLKVATLMLTRLFTGNAQELILQSGLKRSRRFTNG